MSDITIRKNISIAEPFQICFVCLGNICRSPTAEGVFQHQVNERGMQDFFVVDSAGTSAFHIGEPANSKSAQIAKQHGVTLPSRARQLVSSDLDIFDLVIVMDKENLANARTLAHNDAHKNKIRLMRDFDPVPEDGQVPDPYYGGISGFENVFRILERSCASLLDKIEPHISR